MYSDVISEFLSLRTSYVIRFLHILNCVIRGTQLKEGRTFSLSYVGVKVYVHLPALFKADNVSETLG